MPSYGNDFVQMSSDGSWYSPLDATGSPSPFANDAAISTPFSDPFSYQPASAANDFLNLFAASEPLSLEPRLVPGNVAYNCLDDVAIPSSPPQPASVGRNAAHMQLYLCEDPNCKNRTGFKRESDLRRHQQKHDKPFDCKDCTRKFGSKADSSRHRREVHQKDEDDTKPSLHTCPVAQCKRHSRGFGRLWNMQQHLKKAHPGVSSAPESPATLSAAALAASIGSPVSEPVSSPSSNDTPITPISFADASDDETFLKLLETRKSKIERERERIDSYIQQLRSPRR